MIRICKWRRDLEAEKRVSDFVYKPTISTPGCRDLKIMITGGRKIGACPFCGAMVVEVAK